MYQYKLLKNSQSKIDRKRNRKIKDQTAKGRDSGEGGGVRRRRRRTEEEDGGGR